MNTTFSPVRIARAATIALVCGAATMAHASQISLGGATLEGDIFFDTTVSQGSNWPMEQRLTVDPAQIQVTSTADTVGFSFASGWTPYYMAGYQPGFDYSYRTSLDRLGGFTITDAAGHAVDLSQATVTIAGQVTLGDQASIYFNAGEVAQAFNGPGTRNGKTTFDFSFTVRAGTEPVLSWGGSVPYAQGPNGTASVFSTVDLTVQRISFSAPVVAVPEVSTAAMAVMGLIALGGTMACRRRVQA